MGKVADGSLNPFGTQWPRPFDGTPFGYAQGEKGKLEHKQSQLRGRQFRYTSNLRSVSARFARFFILEESALEEMGSRECAGSGCCPSGTPCKPRRGRGRRADGAKLPGAGISPKPCPMERAGMQRMDRNISSATCFGGDPRQFDRPVPRWQHRRRQLSGIAVLGGDRSGANGWALSGRPDGLPGELPGPSRSVPAPC